MSKRGSVAAIRIMEDFVAAVKRGEAPPIDALLAACPVEDREELRLALVGVRDLLETHWMTHVSPQAVEKTLAGMRRIRERHERYRAARERMAKLTGVVLTDPVEAVRDALDIPLPLIQQAMASRTQAVRPLERARGERLQIGKSKPLIDRYTLVALEERMADKAMEILEQHDLDATPTDMDELARRLYLIVHETPLEGLDGYLVAYDDYGAILLNERITNRQRRRFTVGHEIGHFELHRGMRVFKDKLDDQGSNEYDREELEADTLAGMLLVPRPFFPMEFARQRPSFENAEKIADRFDVSLAVALRRLIREAHEACAFVVVEDSKVKWVVVSRYFDHYVRRGQVDLSTVGARLQASTSTHGGDRLPLSAWADAARGTESDAMVWEDARRILTGQVYCLITCL